jgi:hypothetical protein
MRFLFGAPDPVNRSGFMRRAYRFWRSAGQHAQVPDALASGT